MPGTTSPICGEAMAKRGQFLTLMRQVPGAVAIIATRAGDDRAGLSATAWTSLCADPPMLLACINRSASAYPVILRAGAFSINLVEEDDIEAVAIFSAQRGLDGSDRFLPGRWDRGSLEQPLLHSSVAAFECKLKESHEHETHTILIGQVEEMRSQEGVSPLLYLDGQFAKAVGMSDSIAQ